MQNARNAEQDGATEAPKSRWNSVISFLPSKRVLKKIGANLLQLGGTALQIASEITTFVAGMGFFISPPLKKVYAQLQGKSMHYAVNGTGTLCVEMNEPFVIPHSLSNATPNSNFALNTSCTVINNQLFLSSDVAFDLDYPESLFAASAFLLALGCSGFMLAQILKKCGCRLQDSDGPMPPDDEQVALAKKWHNILLAASALSLVTSRVAAVYATTTISMAMTLRKVPNILEDFSINSEKNFVYQPDNPDTPLNPIQSQLLRVLSMHMDFITTINFSALREAARKGSEEIDSRDYYIGIGVAGVALILGYIALKTEQQHKYYSNILLRNKHYLELKQQFFELNGLTILNLREQNPPLETDHSMRTVSPSSVGTNPHSIFSSPHGERRATPISGSFCLNMPGN